MELPLFLLHPGLMKSKFRKYNSVEHRHLSISKQLALLPDTECF